jgi:hypothetical protein
LPVTSEYPAASAAITAPATGTAMRGRASTCGRIDRASQRIPVTSKAASSPIISAQPNSAPVGRSYGGRSGIASVTVPSPVSESNPTKITVPIPRRQQAGDQHQG